MRIYESRKKAHDTEMRYNTRYQIETPEGFVDFDGVGKINIPQHIVRVSLESGSHVDVSITHIFFIDGDEVLARDLCEGMPLQTAYGYDIVSSLELLEEKDVVYDILEVKSHDNVYYANDVLHHNCRFIGSSDTLIDPDVLEDIVIRQPRLTKWNGALKIFEEPDENATYVIGCDTGKGTGRDYSVVQVLKISAEKKIDQVAIYRNNKISPHDFAQVCIGISQYYNDCQMMIENNDIGEALCQAIWYEYEYDNIVNLDPKGLGVRSTAQSKLQGNLLLKRYLDNTYLTIHDEDTVTELSKYVEVRPNVFKGETSTTHDDCITSLLWALYFITTDYFDNNNLEVKKLDEQYDLTNDGPIMFFPT